MYYNRGSGGFQKMLILWKSWDKVWQIITCAKQNLMLVWIHTLLKRLKRQIEN